MPDLNEQMRAEFEAAEIDHWQQRQAFPLTADEKAYLVRRYEDGTYVACEQRWTGFQFARRQRGSEPDVVERQAYEAMREERDRYRRMLDQHGSAAQAAFGQIAIDIEKSLRRTEPEAGKLYLCEVTHSVTGESQQCVLLKVDEDDCDWRTADDHSELSYAWDVEGFQLVSVIGPAVAAPPVADAEGVKPKQWHERTEKMDDASCMAAMKAEIADLRAALSRLNGESK